MPVADGPVAYAKAGARNAMARAVCAVAIALHPARRTATACVVGAAPIAIRPSAAEALVAASWDALDDPATAERFGALVAAAVDPIPDDARLGRLPAPHRGRAGRARAAAGGGGGGGRAMRLTVDGTPHEVDDAHGGQSLLRVLRDVLQITSAKNACEQGECGSCTVAIDGEIACACLVLAAQADGARVETAASLASPAAARCIRSRRRSCARARCSAASARRG